jgi:hypothetical protein
MKNHKINIKINALQDLAIKTLKDGTHVPYLTHSTYIGDMCDPCHESDLPLDEALNRLITQITRGHEDSVTDKDRETMLSKFMAIQNLVKQKIEVVQALPKFEGPLHNLEKVKKKKM